MDLKNKKVTVVGLGESGFAACKLLIKKGAKVNITDRLDTQRIRENISSLDRKNIIDIETGRHTKRMVQDSDLMVTSPGVPACALPILWARRMNIPVIGEIELAFAFCPCPIIAITGTNGKTTVATLTGEIFRKAGFNCVVCGNIGNPFSNEVAKLDSKHIVLLEVSSFQLETIDKFRPKVAVVLNIASDHLDRHGSFDEYLAAKCRIFSNQNKTDWAVLNREDRYSFTLAGKTKAKSLFFSKNNDLTEKFNSLNSNHFAALAIASVFSIPQTLAINTCLNFKGVKHRMEEVAQIKGIKFINDSKATNIDSTLWALNSIQNPVILIAGGQDKGSDFAAVKDRIKGKVRLLVSLGEAKEKLSEAFQDVVLTKKAKELAHAVRIAFNFAEPGDCILLSPMCASFDMFEDFAERGNVFKEAVQSLTNT